MVNFTFTANKKRLFENFTSLSALQVANYVLPLLTLPYLVRNLGPEKFGLIAFAQAFIQYFFLFTDFGFNLSAVREISINRESKNKISEIFCTVYLIKGALLIISFLVLSIAILFIPILNKEWVLYLLMFGAVIGNILFPVWFFQGMEDMKYVTVLNVFSKIIFTILVFTMIKQESDYILFPIINSLGFLISGIIGLWVAFSRFSIKLIKPTQDFLISQLKVSFHFFISRVCLVLYTVSNTFLLGILTTNEVTGFYAAAEKIIRAVESMSQPIINVLYPYISKNKDKRLCKISVYTGTLIGVISFIFFFYFCFNITQLFYGSKFETTANILRIYAVDLLIIFPSGLMGLPILAAFGHIKYLNYTNILGLLTYTVIIGGIVLLSEFDVYSIVLSIIVAETVVLVSRIMGLKKYELW